MLISAMDSRATAVQGASFWCNSVAVSVRNFPLGAALVESADDAISWIRRRLDEIAVQLDPPAVRIVRAWLSDQQRYTEALALLSQGSGFAMELRQDGVTYSVGADPFVPP
ncbi:hypothetical protein [Kitasatospora cheerisanensis]|uniref:hypothetical protein n=1 Tax=Kitasatospora cheerisanensis TaxID=81942 RepID=UPI00068EF94B|nr:hypothetical protein [Kitasatospora cheerisanensis]